MIFHLPLFLLMRSMLSARKGQLFDIHISKEGWWFLIHAPCRYDAHSGGEREIQRTMLELLNQLDGFDSRGDVKVILATNRIESLDPALLRPGRIDRKIEFPLPDIKTRRRIFQVESMLIWKLRINYTIL